MAPGDTNHHYLIPLPEPPSSPGFQELKGLLTVHVWSEGTAKLLYGAGKQIQALFVLKAVTGGGA